MAAPTKKYLSYYNWECNSYDVDSKLQDLSYEHGPLGETVYRRMLDLIYSNGFFIETEIDKLSRRLIQKIGPQWLKLNKCKEILTYCVEIGLFDKNLVQSNIWTSVGIQNRYIEIMVKLKRTLKIDDKKYLVIDIPLIAFHKRVNSEETGVNSEEIGVNSRKEKENKIKQMKTNENKLNDREKDFFLQSAIESITTRFERTLNVDEKQFILDTLDIFEVALINRIILNTLDKSFATFMDKFNKLKEKDIYSLDQYLDMEEDT